MNITDELSKLRESYTASKEQHVAKAREALTAIEALQAAIRQHSQTMAEHEAWANQFNGGLAALNDLIAREKAKTKEVKKQKGTSS